MYTPEEWNVIRQGLDLITITGKDAKKLATLQVKVEKDFHKSEIKKQKDLEKTVKREAGKTKK